MNADIKAKWVAALRSGEYQQGRGRLKTGDAFCCLGVLCDCYGKEHPDSQWIDNSLKEGSFAFRAGNHHPNAYGPPFEVLEWAGLPSSDIRVRVSDVARTVGVDELNDGTHGIEPFSFAQIADAIEEQL
jgi:hypothetical protein